MDVKPQNNNKMRIVTLEDGHFQDETLYRLKKGQYKFVFLKYSALNFFKCFYFIL